jgi:hypothetical protein
VSEKENIRFRYQRLGPFIHHYSDGLKNSGSRRTPRSISCYLVKQKYTGLCNKGILVFRHSLKLKRTEDG